LDSEGVSRTFSNVREINELYEQDWVAGVPTITYSRDYVATVDKTQSVRLKIDMAGVEPNKVRRLAVFASFGYSLHDVLNLEMTGILEAVIETPNGAGRTLFHGDLALDQDEPILIDSVKRVINKEDPLSSNYDSLSMNEIIEQYHWRKGKKPRRL